MNSRTLLIDGDILIYQAAAAVQDSYDWGDGLTSVDADSSAGKKKIDRTVARYVGDLAADAYLIALSDPTENWRKEVLPTYKSNRKGEKPVCFHELRAYVEEAHKTVACRRLEADDVLGLFATGKRIKGERVVVTIDKDLRTVPGLHFNPGHPEEGIVEVGPVAADYNHLFMTLTGDAVDGYSGCPGIGPKRAQGILNATDHKERWQAVVAAFRKKGLTEVDAITQARVARILRYGEYTRTTATVTLWTPSMLEAA